MIEKEDNKFLRCSICGKKRKKGEYMRSGNLEYVFVCYSCLKEEKINKLNKQFNNMTYLEIKHLVNRFKDKNLFRLDKNLNYQEAIQKGS